MTMRTARLKLKRNTLHKQRQTFSRKHRSRVDAAINSYWTLKDPSEQVRELESERRCLRARLAVIAVHDKDTLSPESDPDITRHQRQIDTLTRKLHR